MGSSAQHLPDPPTHLIAGSDLIAEAQELLPRVLDLTQRLEECACYDYETHATDDAPGAIDVPRYAEAVATLEAMWLRLDDLNRRMDALWLRWDDMWLRWNDLPHCAPQTLGRHADVAAWFQMSPFEDRELAAPPDRGAAG